MESSERKGKKECCGEKEEQAQEAEETQEKYSKRVALRDGKNRRCSQVGEVMQEEGGDKSKTKKNKEGTKWGEISEANGKEKFIHLFSCNLCPLFQFSYGTNFKAKNNP